MRFIHIADVHLGANPDAGGSYSERRGREIWNSLEPKTQELLREKAKEACDWGRDQVEQEEAEIVQKFRDGGMIVTELTPEELEVFKEAVQPVREKFMTKYGEEACTAFQID